MTTQCFIKGHPGNSRDMIYREVGGAKAQSLVTVEFVPLKQSRIGETAAHFDVVLGITPSE